MFLRILIAEGHPLFRIGIGKALEVDGGFEIVGETNRGTEVMPLTGRTAPEVVLLDARIPALDAFTCLDRLRVRYPDVHVVMFSRSADPNQVQAAFERGARGFIVKSIAPGDLGEAIRQAIDGGSHEAIGRQTIDRETAVPPGSGLTVREFEIARAVAHGLVNKAVAQELWVTEQTVKFHLTNIYRKLGVSHRTELVSWALSHGVFDEGTMEAADEPGVSLPLARTNGTRDPGDAMPAAGRAGTQRRRS